MKSMKMKTYQIRQNDVYIQAIGDGYEIQGSTLLFYENSNNGGVPTFTTVVKEWDYFNELGPRIHNNNESKDMRIHRLETDRNELRAEVLGLKAEIEDLRTDLDLNTKDRL